MAKIQRLTDSCLLITTDQDTTLVDPGFHTWQSDDVDLNTLPDVSRVLITHAHGDHASPEFVSWLVHRKSDLTVYSNHDVATTLASKGIEVSTEAPEGVLIEDVLHARVPNGSQPPNRAFTVDGVLTHPGDSREPSSSAPVLALPLLVPWDSATGAVEFARRLGPAQVVPVHDFYLSKVGRSWIRNMIKGVLAADGIELVDLDWGEGFTV